MPKPFVSYMRAIEWVVEMDDISELDESMGTAEQVSQFAPVTVSMISDLWETDLVKVIKDIRRKAKQLES